MTTPTDNTWLDELIDKYRADIMLAAQGMSSDNETYRDSAVNVAALSSLNLKNALRTHLDTVCREAYKKGYIDKGIEELTK